MSELQAKTKRKRGRPAKYLQPDKAFSWFDEKEYNYQVKCYKDWERAFESLKIITGAEFETLAEYEADLRSKYPDLEKLDIKQLYILENIDRPTIERAYAEFCAIGKPDLNKENYTINIPAERAGEYGLYLNICNAFNQLREDAKYLNIAVLPSTLGHRIVLNEAEMKLEVNAHHFKYTT